MDVLLQQLPEGRKPTYVLLGRVRWRIKPPKVTTQCLHLNPLRSATGRVDSRLEGTGWCELHHGGFPSWGKSISQLHQNFWGNCIRIADLSHPGRFWEFSKPSVGVPLHLETCWIEVGGKLDSQAQLGEVNSLQMDCLVEVHQSGFGKSTRKCNPRNIITNFRFWDILSAYDVSSGECKTLTHASFLALWYLSSFRNQHLESIFHQKFRATKPWYEHNSG